MPERRGGNAAMLETELREAVARLDESAIAALTARPGAARAALAAAAGALTADAPGVETIGGGEFRRIDPEEAERALARRVRPGPHMDVLTSRELAARAGLKSRQTVHDWRRKGRIVGWRTAKRGYVFPAGQFDARGSPVEGLARVAPRFGDGYAAWLWLTTPAPALDGEPPLALLKRGKIDSVARAAEAYAQGGFM